MKKQRFLLLSLLLAGSLLSFTSNGLFAEEDSIYVYGHISYIDEAAKVIRQDQTEYKAVVNLPVVPGDQIVTGEKGRCELQFDNGTVIRLDKDSRLKVTTVLAPALTSKWKITTLHLMRGQLYSMNQSYNREMFQVITPNAAVDLKKRSSAAIQLDDRGNTHIFADRGKFKVLYGGDAKYLQTAIIRPGNGCTITPDNQAKMNVEGDTRDIDFRGWNEYVNRNFKDLHYGTSKVPKKIYRFNKAIVYWAEKWSSLVGEWVYDELFGYVWKPADEIFRFSSRPFFHASYVKINGRYFVVPQQPWGWAPAHLGTWVWMKGGWTWVPGNTFNSGIYADIWGFAGRFAYPGFFFPSLDFWLGSCYGSEDLYFTYRRYYEKDWRQAYRKVYNRDPGKQPLLKNIPQSVRELIKKMNNAPLQMVKDRLGDHHPSPAVDVRIIKPLVTPPAVSKKGFTFPTGTIKVKSTPAGPRSALAGSLKNSRDWNPDKRWAIDRGYRLHYSSKSNAVICPDLDLNSRTISPRDRAFLRGRGGDFFGDRSRRGDSSGSSSDGPGATGTSRGTANMGAGQDKSGVGNSTSTKNDK